MDIEIAGVSLYYIISWFFVYSFLGWLWETAYVSVRKKKFVNRGFINGPLCTIYGMGAVSIYLILKPFGDNLAVLYIGGVVVATILEYITGWLMEKIFHTRWWDYSHRKYNLQGYISLGTSLGWGVFTVLLFEVLQPAVYMVYGFISSENRRNPSDCDYDFIRIGFYHFGLGSFRSYKELCKGRGYDGGYYPISSQQQAV